MSGPMRRSALKAWYEPAAIPIWVIIGGAVAGCGWYLVRLAKGPDVVWDRHNNPEPWNNVKQGQNQKMLSVNQKFDSKYQRGWNIGSRSTEEGKQV